MKTISLFKVTYILIIILALQSCSKKGQTDSAVVRVGESTLGKIDEKDFLYSYELTPSPANNLSGLTAKKAHLDMMIKKKLMVLEGLKQGLDNDAQVRIALDWYTEKAVRQQLYREVARDKVEITEGELRNAFQKSNTTVRVRHLPAKTLEEATRLRNKLMDGDTFFSLAARAFKDSVLANNGGDLGYFSFGDMDEAIERAAFSLEVGKISEPVKSDWAYHILRVEEKKKKAILTESEFVRTKYRLDRIIRQRKEKKIANQYIRDFMEPKHVRVYGPSIVFLVNRGKQLANKDESPLPQDPLKLRDSEIGEIRQSIKSHLGEVIVEFEGGKWTIGDFLEKLKKIQPDARPSMVSRPNLKNVVARMVRDEFLAQEGYRRDLKNSDYVKEEVQYWTEELVFSKMRKILLDSVSVTKREIKKFYDQNKARYIEPPRVNIREIFVSDEHLANKLLTKARTGGNFAELAEKHSLRKWAAARGGEFGFFGPGMHGEIGRLALEMETGQLVGPVAIEDTFYGHGFSIFQVIARKEGRYNSFGEVKQPVEKDALILKQEQVLKQFLNAARKNYTITVGEELLAKIKTTSDFAKGRKVEMLAVPRF